MEYAMGLKNVLVQYAIKKRLLDFVEHPNQPQRTRMVLSR